MKLVIQIPCLNEAETLPGTLADFPKSISGIDIIEVQIIDDGSSDRTIEIARECGVHHIVDLGARRGLAHAFKAGLENALMVGADIIVNTDGDNQYCGADIPKLIQPILEKKADMVIGERPIFDHKEFSLTKKILQKLGSQVVGQISQTSVPDATSGFRAFSAHAAMKLHIFSGFSYTLETIIQAGYSNLRIASVPIRVNSKTRESRLFRSNFQYLTNSGLTMAKIFAVYRSNFFFSTLGVLPILSSFVLAIRYSYLVFYKRLNMTAFWPSILFAGFLLIMGFQLFLSGILAELSGTNRKLLEELLYLERKKEFGKNLKDDKKNSS